MDGSSADSPGHLQSPFPMASSRNKKKHAEAYLVGTDDFDVAGSVCGGNYTRLPEVADAHRRSRINQP